jgi:hypothetical protein
VRAAAAAIISIIISTVVVLPITIAACGLVVSGGSADDEGPPTNGGGTSGSNSSSSSSSSSSSGADATFYEDGGLVVPDDGGSSTPRDASLDAPIDTYVPPPNSGNALRFSNGSYVSMGQALAIPADFTLEAWIRPMSFGGERYIAAKDRQGQGAGQFRLGVGDTERLFFIMSDAGGDSHGVYTNDYQLISPAAITANVWTHVAVTKSGAQFSLLINGAAVSNVTATASFNYGGPAVDFRVAARVASNGSDNNGGFDGAIDEVRLWNVARTPAMIQAARSMVILAPHPASLVAYYRFDEGSGTTTASAKAGAPNGTLMSSPMWIASGIF